jgi:papain like protease/dockerin type I repeat protein
MRYHSMLLKARSAFLCVCCSVGAFGPVACGSSTGAVSTSEGSAREPSTTGIGTVLEALDTVHPLGAIRDSDTLLAAKRLRSTPPPAGLPSSVDLSSQVPLPGDQMHLGSCVGWAVGYAAKSFHEVNEEGWSRSTANHQFSASWIYNQLNGGSDGGTYISWAMDLLVNSGADSLASFPYVDWDYTTQPNATSHQRAARFPAKSWNTLAVAEVSFKNVLAGHNVIVIGTEVLPDFDALNGSTNTVYDDNTGSSRGRHALAIIGYNDTKQAFRFINSWGTSFGDGGYGWIGYSFINEPKLYLDAYVMVDKANLPLLGDANTNDCVDNVDYAILSASYGYGSGNAHYDWRADFNHDGWVDNLDYLILSEHWNEGC